MARQIAGVHSVADRLTVVGDSRIQPAQYEMTAQPQPTQVAMGFHGMGHGAVYDGAPMSGEMMAAPMGGEMVGGPGMGMGFDGGPLPEGPAVPGATQAAMGGDPNYAWPSYAPHPNFSAVGYPTVYPWQAWPNIGPFYPYPEVPLGWRAVTLRWDDGLWWLDFKKHYTRPFFTPYPFGIFGY